MDEVIKIENIDDLISSNNKLTFVTLSFSDDIANLLLQARSFRIHASDLIKEWIIVFNDTLNNEDKNDLKLHIAHEIKGAKFKVYLLDYTDVTNIDLSGMHGSRSQQILKIEISKFVSDELFVMLDSKNHAIKNLHYEYFVRNGMPVVHTQKYEPWNPFQRWFFKAFSLVGLPEEEEIIEKYQSTTPYVMVRSILLKCREKNLLKDDRSWEYFISKLGDDPDSITEFSLYAAVFELEKAKAYYSDDASAPIYVTLWPGWPDTVERTLVFISQMMEDRIKFFGVHRGRGRSMDDREAHALSVAWVKFGLFESSVSAENFLRIGFVKGKGIPK